MQSALPCNCFLSLHALMQSEDVVCLSSHPWDEAWPVYGAALAEMARVRHWRVFFVEQDRLSPPPPNDLHSSSVQLRLEGTSASASARIRLEASGIWLIQLLIECAGGPRTNYDILRKRRLLCEFLHEASVHEPLLWCLDAQAVAVARGLAAALAVYSGQIQPVSCAVEGAGAGAGTNANSVYLPGYLIRNWADLVLPETAFSRASYDHAYKRDQSCAGVQAIVGALSTRLAALNV